MRPCGVAVTKDDIFVTDMGLHALFQFSKKDCKLIGRAGTKGTAEGFLDCPRGLCVDHNGDIYIADHNNNRVTVISKYLHFTKSFGSQQLQNPRDVKVTPNSVVVLDNGSYCVHIYSRSGIFLTSSITHGMDGIVNHAIFFCLDNAGNIVISDWLDHNIKILSPTGQLVKKVGRVGNRRGELYHPHGIDVSESGKIYVLSNNLHFYLQSF